MIPDLRFVGKKKEGLFATILFHSLCLSLFKAPKIHIENKLLQQKLFFEQIHLLFGWLSSEIHAIMRKKHRCGERK